MALRLFAIRGAVCSENTKDGIISSVSKMCSLLFEKNNITPGNVVSIQFSVTQDLDELNPATALRKSFPEFSNTALFCTQEAFVKGMLPKTIRVLLYVYLDENAEVEHVYTNGAEVLRPDRAKQ